MTSIPEIFETMAYGPAPEAAAPAHAWLDRARAAVRAVHRRRRGPTRRRRDASRRVNPATGKPLARLAQADRRRRGSRRCARPGRRSPGGGRSAATPGRAISTRWPARSRSTPAASPCWSRSTTASRSARSRDIDIPLVARHFYHHAGWAQLMDARAARPRAGGRHRADHPVELPAADAGLEDRARAGDGQHGGAQARRVHLAHRPAFAELCQEIGLPAGRGQHHHRRRPHRRGAGHPSRSGQDRLHRLDRRRPPDPHRDGRAAARSSRSSWAASRPSSSSTTPTSTAWSKAWWTRSGSTRARSAAPARACWCRRAWPSGWWPSSAPDGDAARGRPAGQGRGHRRDHRPGAAAEDPGAGAAGRGRRRGMWQPSWSCPREGWFFPPTLFTDVAPAATIAQVEIFGPVVVLMTFRTPAEAVELANNTRYGLAASVWTENINLALDVAPQLKAGTVWINCTNVFDAAGGFGGYRESGFGREGGREGLWEYVRWPERADRRTGERTARGRRGARRGAQAHRDAQAKRRSGRRSPAVRRASRPSTAPPSSTSAASRRGRIRATACRCSAPEGRQIGEVGHGNRKDIRNAVEAARKARGLGPGDGARARADALLPGREPGGPRRRVRPPDRGAHRRRAPRREREVDARDRADLHLRRLGRQVRRPGPPHAAIAT